MEGSHAKGKKLLSLAWRELDGGAGGKNGGFNGGASRLWQSWWRRRLGRCWSRRCYGGNGRRGDIERKKRERERERWRMKNKEKPDFMPSLNLIFFILDSWNPPLFIGGGKGKSCLHWRNISALDLVGKDYNRWFKVGNMNCQIWQFKAAWVSHFRQMSQLLWYQFT